MLKQHQCKQVATYAQSNHHPHDFDCAPCDLASGASAQSEEDHDDPYQHIAPPTRANIQEASGTDSSASAQFDCAPSDLAAAQFDHGPGDLAFAQSECAHGYPCASSALASALCDSACAQYNLHSSQSHLPPTCHALQEQATQQQTHAPMLQETLSSFGFSYPTPPYGLRPF